MKVKLQKHFHYIGFMGVFQQEKPIYSIFGCYKLTYFVTICSKQPRMNMRGC
ncbi:hypothetical protein HMPREF3293_01320 [Christensenella minuta]|uniref:Uncharacterized protein n=1 Tax=Christensenella minuta TaxID=626937 RepID=A0A136Q592_9FIRM|nr:hypothetical protein HMPREF3293_01320 [Christensenella minuta]